MDFLTICNLFEKLEKSSKRLEKILILRDFYKDNKKDCSKVFDIICYNFFRKIEKRNLGVSVKTIINSFSKISSKSPKDLTNNFNKYGDIGETAVFAFENRNQKMLEVKSLSFEYVLSMILEVSKTSGKNSNKIKEEIIGKLFLNSKNIEAKFLARFLISDLRIGVSQGVLIESTLNIFLPKLSGIHFVCDKCSYINLANAKCLNCENKIDKKNQIDLIKKNHIFLEKDDIKIEDVIFLDKFLISKNSREIYNFYLEKIQTKYNLINSFEKLFLDLKTDKRNIFEKNIAYLNPIKSMLGTRLKDFDEIDKKVKYPIFADFKYDGIRVQIHKKNDVVKIFSRNLENLTKQFPEIVNCFKVSFKEDFILDGECVGYDYINKKYLDFQILSRRILTKNLESIKDIEIQVLLFDIIKLDDKELIDFKFSKRREILEKLFLNREIIF